MNATTELAETRRVERPSLDAFVMSSSTTAASADSFVATRSTITTSTKQQHHQQYKLRIHACSDNLLLVEDPFLTEQCYRRDNHKLTRGRRHGRPNHKQQVTTTTLVRQVLRLHLDDVRQRLSQQQQQCHNENDVNPPFDLTPTWIAPLGPVVGRVIRTISTPTTMSSDCDKNDDNDNGNHCDDLDFDLDPLGWSGEYVSELLAARPVPAWPPATLTFNPATLSIPALVAAAASVVVPNRVRENLQRDGIAVWNQAIDDTLVVARLRHCLATARGLSARNHGQDAEIRTDEIGFVARRRRVDESGCDDVFDNDQSDINNDCDDSMVYFSNDDDDGAEKLFTLASGFDFLEHVVSQVQDALCRGDNNHDDANDKATIDDENGAPPTRPKEPRQQRPFLLRPRLGMVSRYRGRGRVVGKGTGNIEAAPSHGASGNGDFYTWHYDNERSSSNNNSHRGISSSSSDHNRRWVNFRRLTAILYLNEPDWSENDGGQLEYELPACTSAGKGAHEINNSNNNSTHTATKSQRFQVIPTGGTIVLFDSCRIRHQVLPTTSSTTRHRYAMTQWFVSSHDFLGDTETCPCGPRLWRALEQQRQTTQEQQQEEHTPTLPGKRPRSTYQSGTDTTSEPSPKCSSSVCHRQDHWTESSTASRRSNKGSDDKKNGTGDEFSFSFF